MDELKSAAVDAEALHGDFAKKLELIAPKSAVGGNTTACDTEGCTPSNVDACKL